MKRLQIGCLLLVANLTLSGPVAAQDVFGSTGSSSRSYSYIEFQYLTNVDTDTPIYIIALLALNDRLSLSAEYLQQSDSVVIEGFDVDATADGTSVGLLYHRPFNRFEDTDWVAGLAIGKITAEASADALGLTEKTDDNFQQAYLGLRKTLSERLEGEVGIRLTRIDSTDTSGDVRLVYRLAESIDVALGVQDVPDENFLGIGFRYTW